MKTVLVIEDEKMLLEMIKEFLGREFNVVSFGSLTGVMERLEKGDVDLVLSDVTLPDGSGFDLCTRIKMDPRLASTPVLFISGAGDEASRVGSFEIGGDDYILKPFSMKELVVRVRARCRASRPVLPPERFGDLRVSWEMQKAFVAESGKERDAYLTPLEFRILACLCRSPHKIVTRANLISEAWGQGVNVGSRSVDKHVCTLRQKLGSYAGAIRTEAGSGYMFELKHG